MDHSDSELARRSLTGEREAFAQIYDRYARLVRAVCFETTGNIPDAQEVCQEVFLRAWEKVESLKNPDRIGAWLTGIARLVCKEWLRRKRSIRELAESQACVQSLTVDGEEKLHWLDVLFESLRKLPEPERVAIHLFYLQEQSAEQTRSVLGLSTSGFYRVLDRARKRLARLMNQKEEVRR